MKHILRDPIERKYCGTVYVRTKWFLKLVSPIKGGSGQHYHRAKVACFFSFFFFFAFSATETCPIPNLQLYQFNLN